MDIDEYAVYGSKLNAQATRKLVNENFFDKKVTLFIENLDFGRIGTIVAGTDGGGGTPVVSLYEFAKSYFDGKIKGVLIPSEAPELTIRTMKECVSDAGIPEESIFLVPAVAFRKKLLTQKEILGIFTRYNDSIRIQDLYINLLEYCNLNCRSCATCCNLTEGRPVYDLKKFKQDMTRLHELVPDVVGPGLAGGEPLLLDNLCDYIEVVRALWPYGGITVTTNGILLPKLSREKIEIMSKNNVIVRYSLYPSLRKNLDENLTILRESGLSYYVDTYKYFRKRYVRKPYFSKEERFANCGAPCTGFRDGRISYCEVAFFTGKINKAFGTNLPEYSGIDIHDPSLTGEKLMRELKKPLDICSWCAEGLVTGKMPWRASKGDDVIQDYVFCSNDDVVVSELSG